MTASMGRLVVLGLACLTVLAESHGASAAAGDASEALKRKRDALGDVQRRLEAVRTQAAAARQREVSLLAELERMERNLVQKRVELGRLDLRIARHEAELDRLEGEEGRVAEDTVSQQAAVGARLRTLARLRHAPVGPSWFVDDGTLPRFRAVHGLRGIARMELEELERFDDRAERLRQRRAVASRGRRELVALRQRLETERDALDEAREQRRTLLVRVREDRATHERMTAELKEAGQRLEVLVRELARRARSRRVVVRPGPEPEAPRVGLGALRGRLPWPTKGRIVARFGRHVHPRFGTETHRRGVDIEAREGAPIRAVYRGTVLYRGWLKGYGNLIILDHGEGYYTLYGHASDFLVEEGQTVRAGQGIARVGDTGSLGGPLLYFEVRYQGRAQDPEAWLRQRS